MNRLPLQRARRTTHDPRLRRAIGAGIDVGMLEARLLLSAAAVDPAADDMFSDKFPGIDVATDAPTQPVVIGGPQNQGPGTGSHALNTIPQLNSRPEAPATLYLDFLGDPNTHNTPVYDIDGNPSSFNDAELANIQQIWQRVSEGYSPFNINVTTVDPGALTPNQVERVLIGGDGAWTGGSYGGISPIGGYSAAGYNTAFVFPLNLSNGNPRYVGDAAIHEAGHGFGLQHQSVYSGTSKTNEYNPGNANAAPNMGVSYYSTRNLWWKGQSSLGSTAIQDDLAIIASNNFGYAPETVGQSRGAATPLTLSGSSVSGAGVIETMTDQNYWSFTTDAGSITLNVNVAPYGASLDAKAILMKTDGTLLSTQDTASLGETITATLPAGSYVLEVTSHGSYGDIGQYSIAGSIVRNGIAAPVPPSNLAAIVISGPKVALTWKDNSGDESAFTIERSDDRGATWATLTSVAANVTTCSDTTVTSGQQYAYRVYASNAAGASGDSNVATLTLAPAVPSGLHTTNLSSGEIDLAWNDVNGETAYAVDRSTSAGKTWTTLGTLWAGVTIYSDASVSGGIGYSYRVHASNAGGDTITPAISAIAPLPAPAGLSAFAVSPYQVHLSWSAVTNVTGYKIERSLDGGSTWMLAGTAPAANLAYDDKALTPNTTYAYRVRATNSISTSAASDPSTAATPALVAPSQPQLTATVDAATGRVVTLTWAEDYAWTTSYTLQRSADGGATWSALATPGATVTSYVDASAAPGAANQYRINAVNAAGTSDWCTAAVIGTAPVTPTGLAITTVTTNELDLKWNDVIGETGFEIERSTNGTTSWTLISINGGGLTMLANVGLASNTKYYYRVRAVNAVNESAPSGSVAQSTKLDEPTGLDGSSTSPYQVHLTWNDVAGDGGYHIERSTDGTQWAVVATVGTNTTSADIASLAPGATYQFRVRAFNTNTSSDASDPIQIATQALTVPDVPTLFASGSSASVKLTWTESDPWTDSYTIQRSTDNGITWATLTTIKSPTMTYADAKPVLGATNAYQISATNAAGTSGWSNPAALASTAPAAPTGLTITPVGVSEIDLTWKDVIGEAGFKIQRSPNGTSSWTQVGAVDPGVTAYDDAGLSSNSRYYYRVIATNDIGDSPASAAVNAWTKLNTPTSFAGVAASPFQAHFTWSDGAGETGYKIERSTDGITWIVAATTSANATAADVNGLSAETTYFFRLRAANANTSSDPTDPQTIETIPLAIPDAPGILSITGTSVINLTWQESYAYTTGFTLQRSADGGTTWTTLASLAANATTYSDTKAPAGTNLLYRLTASDAAGQSAGAAVSITTVPAIVGGLNVGSITGSAATLTWANVSGETSYHLQRSADGQTWSDLAIVGANVTMFRDTSLAANTRYLYRIAATDAAGDGPFSSVVSGTTGAAGAKVSAVKAAKVVKVKTPKPKPTPKPRPAPKPKPAPKPRPQPKVHAAPKPKAPAHSKPKAHANLKAIFSTTRITKS